MRTRLLISVGLYWTLGKPHIPNVLRASVQTWALFWNYLRQCAGAYRRALVFNFSVNAVVFLTRAREVDVSPGNANAALVLGVELRRPALEQCVPEDGSGRSAHGVWWFAGPSFHCSPLRGWRRVGDGPPRISGPHGPTSAPDLCLLQTKRAAAAFQEGLLLQTVQHSGVRVESHLAGAPAHGSRNLQVSNMR